jgi:hypothetical protein
VLDVGVEVLGTVELRDQAVPGVGGAFSGMLRFRWVGPAGAGGEGRAPRPGTLRRAGVATAPPLRGFKEYVERASGQ